jgi:hypothetical protein
METFDLDLSLYVTPEAVSVITGKGVGACVGMDAKWVGVSSTKALDREVATINARGDLATTQRVHKAATVVRDLSLPAARSIKPVWATNRYAGTRLDVERAIRGMPDAWGRFERRPGAGTRHTALYLPLGGAASRTADELGWTAVAGIVIADLLEGAGYCCEIYAASTAVGCLNGRDVAIRAMLKTAQDPLNENAISRAAHPAFFRGLVLCYRMFLLGDVFSSRSGSTRSIDPSVFGDDQAIAIRHSYSLNEAVAEITRVIKLFSDAQ